MLAVAHYNLAVEYEFIGNINESINSISDAIQISKTHIG